MIHIKKEVMLEIATLHSLIIKSENYDVYKELWITEKITEELKEINKDLTKSAKKYDYSKLPKDNP